MTGLYWVLPNYTGIDRVLLSFIGFYWVLLSFYPFFSLFLTFNGLKRVFFRGFYRVGQGFSGFDCVSTGFYLVSSSWKGSVWVCLGSYGFAWVFFWF